ncbi:hypothetical protein F0L68_03445 [Solihabitans fulvus]|uniref:Plasmid replication, integration and excision activator n=1 Tax=Solihabitans fulvus TaxID=1892852 RepID=A0A5B2XR97_9PSEU|nr:hypothetical protein [Solihabitans fulvus]KAA2266177.1 hypothetical protein F0L68_03445 [Solihabitans fulvus]
MAARPGMRFNIEFDEWFPQGAFIVGDVTAVTEYQSQEDKQRNKPLRPRIDEASGLPVFRVTLADPSAEKDRDKSVTVEIAAKVQPVPPAALPGTPFRPVVLEGLTIQPRAEASGQAKWITYVVRATGMRPVDAGGTVKASSPSSDAGKTSAKAA